MYESPSSSLERAINFPAGTDIAMLLGDIASRLATEPNAADRRIRIAVAERLHLNVLPAHLIVRAMDCGSKRLRMSPEELLDDIRGQLHTINNPMSAVLGDPLWRWGKNNSNGMRRLVVPVIPTPGDALSAEYHQAVDILQARTGNDEESLPATTGEGAFGLVIANWRVPEVVRNELVERVQTTLPPGTSVTLAPAQTVPYTPETEPYRSPR